MNRNNLARLFSSIVLSFCRLSFCRCRFVVIKSKEEEEEEEVSKSQCSLSLSSTAASCHENIKQHGVVKRVERSSRSPREKEKVGRAGQ